MKSSLSRTRSFFQEHTRSKSFRREIPKSESESSCEKLRKTVHENLIGEGALIEGPFGDRRTTYLDTTASGKALRNIEQYIGEYVLPLYGNTHTSTSTSSYQTTLLRTEAREMVAMACGASEDDCVIFVGNGATGALAALVDILGVRGGWLEEGGEEVEVGGEAGALRREAARRGVHASEFEAKSGVGPLRRVLGGEAVEEDVTPGELLGRSEGPMPCVVEDVGKVVGDVAVLVGPWCHHSAFLPFREAGAEMVMLRERMEGRAGVDMEHLEEELKKREGKQRVFGVFSVASNVTGALADTNGITALLHRYGALAIWDAAAAAPHGVMDMNPGLTTSASSSESEKKREEDEDWKSAAKDALVFSSHKFAGGVGGPGVLVVKKRLMRNAVPNVAGGGTVFFVRSDGTPRYLANLEEREEGGTPNIVGAIRSGLCLRLVGTLGTYLRRREDELLRLLFREIATERRIQIVGREGHSSDGLLGRVSIVSMQFRAAKDAPEGFGALDAKVLHWSFAAALLNDLFGIQCRGGCLCAGPHSLRLLGVDGETEHRLEQALLRSNELLRPGFVRIALSYHLDESTVRHVARALRWVAVHGMEMLRHYRAIPSTGEFRPHAFHSNKRPRTWLHSVSFADGTMRIQTGGNAAARPQPPPAEPDWEDYFAQADALLRTKSRYPVDEQDALLGPDAIPLRWFALANDTPLDSFDEEVSSKKHDSIEEVSSKKHDSFEEVSSKKHDAFDEEVSSKKHDTFEEVSSKELEDDDEEITKVSDSDSDSEDENPLMQMRLMEDEARERMDEAAAVSPRRLVRREFVRPPKALVTMVRRAVKVYKMISPGDRVMVALSGGKDSLSMLHLLECLRREGSVPFELRACTVDPQSPAFNPEPLKEYVASLGVPYFYESQPLIDRAKDKGSELDSICAWCARMKRGILYSACRREGCTVLALGQHLDDLAESMVMSLFNNGLVRTMKAHYVNNTGDIRIVRPMVFCRERDLREFASTAGLPVIDENCPACFATPTERVRVKALLRAQEGRTPVLFTTLLKAMRPFMVDRSWPNIVAARGPAFTEDTRLDRRRRILAALRQECEPVPFDAERKENGTRLARLADDAPDILQVPQLTQLIGPVPGVPAPVAADTVSALAISANLPLDYDTIVELDRVASASAMRSVFQGDRDEQDQAAAVPACASGTCPAE